MYQNLDELLLKVNGKDYSSHLAVVKLYRDDLSESELATHFQLFCSSFSQDQQKTVTLREITSYLYDLSHGQQSCCFSKQLCCV